MTTDLRALVELARIHGDVTTDNRGRINIEFDDHGLAAFVKAALDAQAGMVMVPMVEVEFLRDCSDSDMQDGDFARQLAALWLAPSGPVEGGEE